MLTCISTRTGACTGAAKACLECEWVQTLSTFYKAVLLAFPHCFRGLFSRRDVLLQPSSVEF
jgi:hypothetical protein